MSVSNSRRTTIWLSCIAAARGGGSRRTVSATDAVQAPDALTSARAVIDPTPAAIDHRQPPDLEPVGANAARAGADVGAALGGVDGIGDHQPRIVHHAVGIFEGGAERALQRIAERMMGDVDGRSTGQSAWRGKPVIEP